MQRNAGSRGIVAVVMGGSSLEREISIKTAPK